jgi:hypothetical protein
MKALKPTFFVAAVLLGLLPQGAQASCSGNACSAYSVEAKSFSPSDKKFRASLLNKDQSKKVRLKGCMSVPGKFSGYCWDVTIDPGKRQGVENGLGALTKPEEAEKNFVVDITSAEFVQEHVPYSPAPPKEPLPQIKVSVVNGAAENLKILVEDLNESSPVAVLDRTVGPGISWDVNLSAKGGKGRLRWASSTTIPSDYRPPHRVDVGDSVPRNSPKPSRKCGEAEVNNVAPGAKITIPMPTSTC